MSVSGLPLLCEWRQWAHVSLVMGRFFSGVVPVVLSGAEIVVRCLLEFGVRTVIG